MCVKSGEGQKAHLWCRPSVAMRSLVMKWKRWGWVELDFNNCFHSWVYRSLHDTKKKKTWWIISFFFQLKISIDEYNMLNMTRSRGWLISRWQCYWIMGTLTLALIYKYYVNMTELSYRTSPIKQYIYIDHRLNVNSL